MIRLLSLIAIFLTGLSLAQDSGFVQEDAHEHGAALLNVVLDGEELNMEFISPAVNLVGFEYEPSSDEDVAAVEAVLGALEDGGSLFIPAGAADCSLASAETEHVMTDEEGHEHGDEDHGDEHGEEEHSDEHGDEDHEDEDHGDEHGEDEEHGEGEHEDDHEDHDEEHAEGAQHSEFHATYSFACSSPDALSGLDLSNLFTSYPGVEDVDVQYVLPTGQGAAELGADDAVVTF